MADRTAQRVMGEVIRRAREKQALSQEALADQAGLHRTYISLLERGLRNPSLTVITQLARALKTCPSRLLLAFERELTQRGK